MKKNVAEYITHKLKEIGVKRIWAVTGDALNAFADAVQKDDELQWMAMRHEENAAFACYGSAQLTEDIAVCAGTVGPGALHLINGLYNAKKARVPVLAITGQVPTLEIGTGYFQEVDLKKTFDDICGYQAIIHSPEQAPRMLNKALQVALWDRTVVRLEIPHDVTTQTIDDMYFDHPVVVSKSKLICPDEDILKAVDLIDSGKKISILAGCGAREAKEEVILLSEKLNAPIVHSLKGSDVFSEDIENVVGLTGLIGNHPGYSAVMHCDVLLMIGTDFPYTNFLPQDKKVIQIDIRPENLGNRVSINHGIIGDAKDTVRRIIEKVSPKKENDFLKDHQKAHKKWREQMTKESALENDNIPLLPSLFASELNKQASNDAIFALETGESAVWGARYMVYHGQRRIIGSFNHGSMAVGLPACLGAQAAYPNRQVWGLLGDGAFVMAMQDLVTAVRYKLPIKLIVFNNKELGFVKMEMEEAGLAKSSEALKLQNPDFVAYAKACGADGIKVEKAGDIPAAIKTAIASPLPFIIDAVVTSGVLTLPPKITLEEAYGFSRSKAKEAILSIKGDESQWENIKSEIKAYFTKI
ncbi:ubiquinone-dependent pyruvate dehydrogenase [Pedobacter sp. SD-b]|uniref:Ubiquinone-dependent pyruvate dehydrogenase n=1 Tax=Pedobacter segetis TaxID=2793069 RepID=A0ABS1BN20_9SPHI|nr:thiamine pyrophosphate-dependent enzyme [Pedobacter segetis]MBK0384280.1 ubiquinone-dependent pyruvate dehydrogenase [Pedobacter segetis]